VPVCLEVFRRIKRDGKRKHRTMQTCTALQLKLLWRSYCDLMNERESERVGVYVFFWPEMKFEIKLLPKKLELKIC
jgi:hypothetical protein